MISEIIVGDEKQIDFYPRMKIKCWDNEVNFSVGVISEYKGVQTYINKKTEWDDGHGVKARFYEASKDEFEFEVILDSKPKSNVLDLSITTNGLRFYYQPPLTAWERAIDPKSKSGQPRCVRPERIVGSYAAYHDSKMHGKYMAGKAFHIYRPYATDAKGTRVWCDLKIDTAMHIAVPQKFIDTAVYPIIIDPTFGYTTIGGSHRESYHSEMFGVLFTSPADADTAQSIHMYTDRGSENNAFKGVLVLQSNLNIVSNGVTAEVPLTSDTLAWHTASFGTDPTLSASTEYVICELTKGVGATFNPPIYYDSGDANQGLYDETNSYTTPTNPTDATRDANKYSLYCTYTASAAGISIPVVIHHLIQQGLL